MRLLQILFVLAMAAPKLVSASVYMARSSIVSNGRSMTSSLRTQQLDKKSRYELRWALKQQKSLLASSSLAVSNGGSVLGVAIPGYSVPEQIFVGGFLNFLSIYNLIITARILLSWFPQAQGVALLQPVYAVTDPYLNLFRGIIPPIFGLDLSPLLAFFLLNALSTATVALGAEIPSNLQKQLDEQKKKQNRTLFGVRLFPRKSTNNNFPMIQNLK